MQWIKCIEKEPPKNIYVLTFHKLGRIQMQKFDGENYHDPLTCPVDKNGTPLGCVSWYPKSVITHWMELPPHPGC